MGPVEVEGLGLQPLVGDLDLGAELAERLHVEVDGPGPDAVAADQGDEGLADAVEEGPHHEDRHPVEAGVRHRDAAAGDGLGVDGDGVALDLHARPEGAQHARR